MITITKTSLKNEVKKLIKQFPKKKNPVNRQIDGCFHFYKNGKPSCIIGHALYNLGVTADKFVNIHGETVQGMRTHIESNSTTFGKEIKLNADAEMWASYIQGIADNDCEPLSWKKLEEYI